MKNLIALLITTVIISLSMAQTTTVNESFESWPAEGWSDYQYEEGGWKHSIPWGSDLGYGGGNCAEHKIANGATDDWLVSPQIQLISSNYELVFYEKSVDLQYYTYSGVYISTASGNPADGDFIELAESLQIEGNWVEHSIDLSAYDGELIYIAFVYQGDNNCWTHWEVDEVSISPASYMDGALIEIINPVGINPNPSTENVIIKLHNYGTEIINDAQIEWSVNGEAQTTYQINGLNLSSGSESNITVGAYNFAVQNDYLIAFDLNLADDVNSGNNHIESFYYVREPNDASITKIIPEGYIPFSGIQNIIITIKNEGNQLIDEVSVSWQVDDIQQANYQQGALNLNPGESMNINIGQFDFPIGIHTVSTEITISADENLGNNTKTSLVSIATFAESFEGDIFPPELWSAENYPFRDYFNPVNNGGELYYLSQVDNNIFGEISDTLYTPLLEIENGDIINFWVNNSAYFTTQDYLIWKDGSTGEVHLIDEIETQLEQWDEVNIDISTAAGINYIGFVNNNMGSYGNSSLDLISSTANVYLFNQDLGIKSFNFDALALQNEEHSFHIQVKNYGNNLVEGANYTVDIIDENNNTLIQQPGINLQSWEEASIQVDYTFTDIGNLNIHAYINYSNDQQLNNNISVTYPIYVIASDSQIQDVGFAETEDPMIPFNTGGDSWTLGTDDVSQTIYYHDEIGENGIIDGVFLHYNELFAIGQELPLQVSVGYTDLNDLTGGWIPQNEIQLVFDGLIEIFPGINSVYIQFDEPFLYVGNSNLVIQYYQYQPGWPYTVARFYSANDPNGNIRTIRANDVYDLNINNLPAYWGEQTSFPFTSFVYQGYSEEGIISGTVYNNINEPLVNAKIAIDGFGMEVITENDGSYSFPELPYNNYTVSVTAFGFIDQTQEIVLDQTEETLDFVMEPLPLITLSGNVFGSNAPSVPLENVSINITGYTDFSTSTNSNGEFIINNIYGLNQYEITFEIYGYQLYTETIDIINEDYNMGGIILNEEFISAYNVWAEAGVGQAYVEWLAPGSSAKVKLQNDNDAGSYSLTNEPYEEVWLGNYFENNDLITLTSVEVLWDIYENAHDYLTIDIMNNNGEVLVSSMPFQTLTDTLMTIDIPNISISEGFYAMVHWKNNPESTDALTFEYGESTPNTAYIKYPGQTAVLISDFLGISSASFILRVNTLQETSGKSENSAIAYNVYKGLSSLINEAPWSWEQINNEPITELYFLDENWTGNTSDSYTYAIESVYQEGDAEYSFSNFIDLLIGVSEAENTEITIYPNPASSRVYLENLKADVLEIYNSLGERVYILKNIAPNISIDVSHLENGNYFIVLKSENSKTVNNLIISK